LLKIEVKIQTMGERTAFVLLFPALEMFECPLVETKEMGCSWQ